MGAQDDHQAPGENGFDADLLVFVNPVQDWTANDYILELRSLFRSSKTYRVSDWLSYSDANGHPAVRCEFWHTGTTASSGYL